MNTFSTYFIVTVTLYQDLYNLKKHYSFFSSPGPTPQSHQMSRIVKTL